MTEPLYSTSAAAAMLGITPARVRALAQSRGLGRKPLGGTPWLFTPTDIEGMRYRIPGRPPGAPGSTERPAGGRPTRPPQPSP